MFADQEVLVFEDRRWTYGQLWEEIQKLAVGFRKIGIERGDRVGVLQTNSDYYVASYFAAAAMGAVFVPLNYRAKQAELEYMINTAQAKALFVGDRYVALAEAMRPSLSTVQTYVSMDSTQPGMTPLQDLLTGSAEEFVEAEIDDDDTTILMYTSGTTSLPKGVILRYNDFTAYVVANVELADGSPRGTGLLCAPLYHIAGATNIMSSMFTGRKLVVLRQFDAGQWLEAVDKEKVTHAFVVPTMMKQLIDNPKFEGYDLTSLQNLSYGGALMPFPVIRRAIEMFPKTVGFVNAFGQTETTSTVMILGPEDHRLDGPPEEVERNLKRLASVGRPLPDVQVKVVDDDGNDLPQGVVGELWVFTPRTMKGYATDKESVKSPALDGWLPTSDMGWIDEDGYVFLAGRKDDMIIRGGENIAPAEVEAVIYSHPGVEEAAVIGLPDVEWGQQVVAVVAKRAGMEVTAEDVMEFCRERLSSFKKPQMVRFVDELPKNHLGKVLKKDLRADLEAELKGS